MPAIKAFIYFVVLKAAMQLMFDESLTILAAGLIAVAMTLIEVGAVGAMTPAIGLHMVRARYQGASERHLISSTFKIFFASFVACSVAAIVIIYAFSDDLSQQAFYRYAYNHSATKSAAMIAGVVLALNLASYVAMVWAVTNRSKSSADPTVGS